MYILLPPPLRTNLSYTEVEPISQDIFDIYRAAVPEGQASLAQAVLLPICTKQVSSAPTSNYSHLITVM